MKNIKAILFIIISFPILFAACSKIADVQPNELGYDYFPLEKGQYTIYDITDVTYTLADPPLVERYQVKEVVKDTFTDVSNKIAYRIERFIRFQVGDSWELDSVWTARRTSNQAIRTENNISFVKMVFPLQEGSKWDGNIFNTRGKDEYLMKALNKKFTVNGQVFEQTLTVVQSADSTVIDQDKRIEVYAKNIGLIYKEKAILAFCQASDCIGQGKIDLGSQRIQKIIGYGKE